MTETISTRNDHTPQASFFKQYLRYGIDKNKTYLLISTVLAVIAIPLFVITTAAFFINLLAAEEYNEPLGMIIYFSNMFVGASCIGLYILALTGGARCFKVLTRRSRTDTLMCLPLNHSQRFWGDFLTGYITSAAPILPAGIVGIIIGAIVQGSHPTQHFAMFAFLYALTIFFFMTFGYTLSVLAAALCGNIPGSIVTSAVLAIISIGSFECWGRFFVQCIAGFPGNQYLASKMIEPVPSLTAVINLLGMFGNIDLAETDSINFFLDYGFAVKNPLNIVFYILLSAGLTALAYFISKHRKPEHNGEVFAAKYGASAVTILLLVTVIGGVSFLFMPEFGWIISSVAAVIASAIICVAAELILRQGVKKLGKRVIAYAVAACAAIGVSILIYGTHALGYSYYIPRADKIVSVQCKTKTGNVLFTFNKKSDIEKFRDNHEQFLRTYMDYLGTHDISWENYEDPEACTIEYALDNGKTYKRYYQTRIRHFSPEAYVRESMAQDALNKLPTALEDYVAQYTAPLDSPKIISAEVSLGGTFGSYIIYPGNMVPNKFPNKLAEFAEVLKKDIEDHFDPEAMPIGYATVADNWGTRDYYILDTYTNTIAFARDPANAIFDNRNYTDDEPMTKYVISYNGQDVHIHLSIRENDNSPAVKELESLIKVVNSFDTEKVHSEEIVRALKLTSPDQVFNYYITENDQPQALKLILQIASERS